MVIKKTLIIAVGLTGLTANASILNITSGTLNLTGTNTTSASYSTALSVQANTAGNILVIGTFSTEAAAKAGLGSWQLSNGTQNSTAIVRTLDSKNDKGIASVAHVFTNVTSGSSINLQHKTTANDTLHTFGGNLVAIPLAISTGEKLNHGLHQQSTPFQTSSSVSFVDTGIKTTVQLDRSSNNGVYMAASFNAQAIDGAETGIWQLQYRKVGDSTWIDTGTQMKRTKSDTSDIGAVTMYALKEGLPPGEYEVQLAVKTETGTTIETLDATLAAVSLSYTNATGGGYFDGFSIETNTLNEIDSPPYTGAQTTLNLENAGSGIFSSMSFDSSAEIGANNTGGFDLWLTNSVSAVANQQNERLFDDITDFGSGASAGYFGGLDSGEYIILGRSENVKGKIHVSNVTLVGFSTEAIPEPAVASLIIGFGCALLAARRIFMK